MSKVKRPPQDRESGVILVSVLWLVALVSVLIMGALQEWRTELKLAANFQAKAQCRRLAEGGVYYAIGKILAREIALRNPEASFLKDENFREFWPTDGSVHALKLPVGRVEIIITDESGKLNLNTAPREDLERLLSVWEYPTDQVKTMVDAILDWRAWTPGDKNFFRSLTRPVYSGNNFPFDTVEEILWLPACAGLAPPRLSSCFTVQKVEVGINLNAASPDVLMALGLTTDQAQQIVDARSVQPFRDLQALGNMVDFSQRPDLQTRVSLQPSNFYTIFSSGMVDYNKSRHSVKAIVRLTLDKPELWSILYWADDYPSE
jgi:general secretion pathway protein K